MSKLQTFYKLARPDGWDFYTGKTINYRDNIGKTVKCPKFYATGELCSSAFIHASREPNQCFVGSRIPCSAYVVKGKPIREDSEKCGFGELIIVKELNPAKLFKWRYDDACNPLHPLKLKPPKRITKTDIGLLRKWHSVSHSVWDSVWHSVWDSVWASVGDSVWDSVSHSVWNSVWDSVWASVGDSVGDSVWDSVADSVYAYMGYIFVPVVDEWQYVKYRKGVYPFMSSVKLWQRGLVPSYDGKLWRLHGHEDAKILWEGG